MKIREWIVNKFLPVLKPIIEEAAKVAVRYYAKELEEKLKNK